LTIREGFKITIVGPPNAGKSTLINLLADKSVSIVSGTPGTTRDLVSSSVTIGGYQVILTDTAGIRESQDEIEREGIKLAKNEILKSHCVLLVLDLTALVMDLEGNVKITKEIEQILESA